MFYFGMGQCQFRHGTVKVIRTNRYKVDFDDGKSEVVDKAYVQKMMLHYELHLASSAFNAALHAVVTAVDGVRGDSNKVHAALGAMDCENPHGLSREILGWSLRTKKTIDLASS